MSAPAGGKVGVLIVNLGTPDAPTVPAVRRYLGEFLSDRRVVELPAVLWQPVLRGVILNVRSRSSAALYRSIWDGDSPLRKITAEQGAALDERLRLRFGGAVVTDWAMRYGRPSLAARLRALREARVDRLLVAPLYPQYSAASTASVLDAVFAELATWRAVPALRTLPPYYCHPAYLEAVTAQISTELSQLPFEPELIIASFHGLPKRSSLLGDPYEEQCAATVRELQARLGPSGAGLRLSFQSRFGPTEWLGPYTETLLRDAASDGIRRVAVLAPGFAADCLETVEELGVRARTAFLAAGGTDFALLPCLNASERGIDMIEALVLQELAGWLDTAQ